MQRLAIYSLALMLAVFGLTKKTEASFTTQDEQAWERYRGKGENFTVSFPERPLAVTTYRPVRFIVTSEEENYRGTLYSAYGAGIVYLVYSFPRRSETLKQIVAEFGSRYPRQLKVVSAHDFNMNGFPAQRYLIKLGSFDGVWDFYLTENRAYILQVVGADESNVSVKRFLESFAFDNANGTDKPADAAVVEVKPGLKNNPQTDSSSDVGTVFAPQEVTNKAMIVLRQEPQYTEEARRGRVSGTVVIKAVLSRSGKVTNIEAVKSLPRGLTEKAIEATRQIKFIPARKDGVIVSQSVQVEYGFSVY